MAIEKGINKVACLSYLAILVEEQNSRLLYFMLPLSWQNKQKEKVNQILGILIHRLLSLTLLRLSLFILFVPLLSLPQTKNLLTFNIKALGEKKKKKKHWRHCQIEHQDCLQEQTVVSNSLILCNKTIQFLHTGC